ncbi:hypothetical protein NM208_g4493 [Fusarium decemcellulare]|uniref:Uncharacterized protein n=1 Tax=Fusarium decemcellulare TaxID=57161 RepID=A0ACC1SKM0_9HYPO|nr:hypothetical protein NM208_g4493 [Fusarium decemcellulare]
MLWNARTLTTQQSVDTVYRLGPNSYFSESSYVMHNWTARYWGEKAYEQLLAVKKAHDPGNHFWCHHCVGDDPDDAYGEPLGAAPNFVKGDESQRTNKNPTSAFFSVISPLQPHHRMAQSPTEEAESPVAAQTTAAAALHSPEHWAQLAEIHEEGDQDDGDSALDPDSAETTASITSSILQYRTIHGRTFHSERGDAQYWAANDEQNNDSLDIGDFADEHPNAQVIGTDISPIQPTWVPPNLTFEIEDCTVPWTFEPGSIDYIHIRYLFGSISDWKALFGEAYKACKPGGWVESCECSPKMESDDGTVKDGSAMNEWGKLFVQGAKKIGRSFTVLEEEIQEKCMREAGFLDIQVKDIQVPIGGWPKDETLKEAGRFAQLALERDLEGYTCYIASQFLGWSREEISVYCAQLRRELHNGKVHAFYRQKVVFGRKSAAA